MTKKLPLRLKETRKPIQIACGFCHEKHLQCDVGRPCKNCIKRNISSLCRDKVRKRRKRSTTDEKENCVRPEYPPETIHSSFVPGEKLCWKESYNLLSENNDKKNLKRLENTIKVVPDTENLPNMLREKRIEGASDVTFDDVSDTLHTQWEFGSIWTNDEYMKLGDLANLVSGGISEYVSCDPVSMDEVHHQNNVHNLPNRASQMFECSNLDAALHRTNSRPYISLNMLQSDSSKLKGSEPWGSEELSSDQQKCNGNPELTPFKLRQLIRTPQELFEKKHLIKPHNYKEAYDELLKRLHNMFLGSYYPQRSRKWLPLFDNDDQKKKHRLRRKQLQQIAASIGRRYIPMFVALSSNVIEDDLLLHELTLQRTLLEIEDMSRLVNCTPLCIWRRSGEICYASNEFYSLTGFCTRDLLDGKKFIVEFMDHRSIVDYYDLFHDHLAFGPKEGGKVTSKDDRGVYGDCNILLKSGTYLKCACCLTVRRDNFNISLLIVGQFLPIFEVQ